MRAVMVLAVAAAGSGCANHWVPDPGQKGWLTSRDDPSEMLVARSLGDLNELYRYRKSKDQIGINKLITDEAVFNVRTPCAVLAIDRGLGRSHGGYYSMLLETPDPAWYRIRFLDGDFEGEEAWAVWHDVKLRPWRLIRP